MTLILCPQVRGIQFQLHLFIWWFSSAQSSKFRLLLYECAEGHWILQCGCGLASALKELTGHLPLHQGFPKHLFFFFCLLLARKYLHQDLQHTHFKNSKNDIWFCRIHATKPCTFITSSAPPPPPRLTNVESDSVELIWSRLESCLKYFSELMADKNLLTMQIWDCVTGL